MTTKEYCTNMRSVVVVVEYNEAHGSSVDDAAADFVSIVKHRNYYTPDQSLA